MPRSEARICHLWEGLKMTEDGEKSAIHRISRKSLTRDADILTVGTLGVVELTGGVLEKVQWKAEDLVGEHAAEDTEGRLSKSLSHLLLTEDGDAAPYQPALGS
jgi:hypothetical protein